PSRLDFFQIQPATAQDGVENQRRNQGGVLEGGRHIRRGGLPELRAFEINGICVVRKSLVRTGYRMPPPVPVRIFLVVGKVFFDRFAGFLDRPRDEEAVCRTAI
ncbi:TPA: hypothetical protein ACKWYA_002277, partial [Neisseria gonorrhoeae]